MKCFILYIAFHGLTPHLHYGEAGIKGYGPPLESKHKTETGCYMAMVKWVEKFGIHGLKYSYCEKKC